MISRTKIAHGAERKGMTRIECIEKLKVIKEEYQPEIYAKDTWNKRMAIGYAITFLETLGETSLGRTIDAVEKLGK